MEASDPRPQPAMAAAILAAGQGRRLGHRPKAALRIGGTSLLERMAGAIRAAGVPHLSVVLGPYLPHLRPLAEACGADLLVHPAEQTSLIDSQRLALDHHARRFAGADLLLVLADLPLLSAADLRPLLVAWRERPATALAQVPLVDGVRGHPVLLSWQAVEAVRATPRHLGIRDWLTGHREALHAVACDRAACVTDLDTPADLETLRARLAPMTVEWPSGLLDPHPADPAPQARPHP